MNYIRYKLVKTMSDEYLLLDTKIEVVVKKPHLLVGERIKNNYYGVFEIRNEDSIDSDNQFVIIASTAKYSQFIAELANPIEQLKSLFKEQEEECFCEIEEEDLALDIFNKPNKDENWFPIATEGEAVLYSRPLIKNNTINIKEICSK